ncbi:putative endo-beta-1,4-glucanase D [Colletotrichum spaethianum]|uniref:lytic cellulose monooxygenase (C4-dehydrogenating) n=1 Tax=Colletotrichum spaethianum TaxID=700344 RepID=A0AA37L702_9PEZI|nr:putative endo-beta-1,4-glucanase D [Colletotrichum spaethianum]GKT43007.1 putative endo-beta-1,4-glucanase D [Colletotrichum spaethianum]
MKLSAVIVALAAASAEAHYTFGRVVYGGTTYPEWQHVRKTLNFYSNGPTDGVSSTQIRCYEADAKDRVTVKTLPVTAGSTIGFAANSIVGHPGPASFWMAKVPAGQTAATWDGSGAVWFKIYHERPTITSSGLEWASFTIPKTGWDEKKLAGFKKKRGGQRSVGICGEFVNRAGFPLHRADSVDQRVDANANENPNVTDSQVLSAKIPSCIASGEYLIRVEHLALHGAGTEGGAQFYVGCAQVSLSGGGSTSPSGLVSFPGAYKSTDPGILFQPYWPTPTSYTNPGPAPFAC